MVKATMRKIVNIGSSCMITLPKSIVDSLKLKPGLQMKIALLHGQVIMEPLDTDITVSNTQGRHKVVLTP